MLPLIDTVYSARLILGRAGREVSPEQLLAFSDALSDVLINRYSDSLIEFTYEELLQVMPMKGKNTDKAHPGSHPYQADHGRFCARWTSLFTRPTRAGRHST